MGSFLKQISFDIPHLVLVPGKLMGYFKRDSFPKNFLKNGWLTVLVWER